MSEHDEATAPRSRWARLEALFEVAIALPSDERDAFVARVEPDDAALRDELSRLVAAHRPDDGFLEPPSPDAMPKADGAPTPAAGPPLPEGALPAGTRVGTCVLHRLLGMGGMAVVYEATQERPNRRVAVKLIRPGIASPEVVRRFELEAEILGRLDHPAIATVHEAGTADTGSGPQPYFVMEFVRGLRLDAWVRAHKPSMRARLELLACICDAIQHAHQKGVIHRDLKPANILVTDDGEPKILDFGVARVTAPGRDQTMATAIGRIVGTLHYLSPEQARGAADALDTRSDVYALGVLGYELLSGQLPYRLDQCMLHEAVRVICEDEPTRLSTVEHDLRGDVETIIGKALAKQPARRYQSASELADDIRRHLRDEPIAARPASVVYHLGKFARRHRVLVASTAIVAVSLVAATAASWVGLRQARAAAVLRGRTLEFVDRDFFGVLDPSVWPAPLRRTAPLPRGADESLPVARLLRTASLRLDDAFPDDPAVQAELHAMFGRAAYGLRELDDAQSHFERALALRTGDDAASRRAGLADRTGLARIAMARGDWTGAQATLEEVATAQRAAFGPDDADARATAHLLAAVTERLGDAPSAERDYRALLERALALDGPAAPSTLALRMSLGGLCWQQDRFDEARTLYAEVAARTTPADWRRMSADWSLAILDRETDPAAADARYRAALAFGRDRLGRTHDRTRGVLHGYASFLRDQGRLDEVEQQYLDEIAACFAGDTTPVHNLAALYRTQGRADDALLFSALAVRLREQDPLAQPWELPLSMDGLAQAHLLAGDAAAAEAWSGRALALWAERGIDSPRHRAALLRTRAKALAALDRADEAETLRAEAQALDPAPTSAP